MSPRPHSLSINSPPLQHLLKKSKWKKFPFDPHQKGCYKSLLKNLIIPKALSALLTRCREEQSQRLRSQGRRRRTTRRSSSATITRASPKRKSRPRLRKAASPAQCQVLLELVNCADVDFIADTVGETGGVTEVIRKHSQEFADSSNVSPNLVEDLVMCRAASLPLDMELMQTKSDLPHIQ